jgi:hypothetical protein
VECQGARYTLKVRQLLEPTTDSNGAHLVGTALPKPPPFSFEIRVR